MFGERHTARTLRQDGALSADADRVFGDDRVSSERVGGDETDVQTRLDHAVSTLLHRTRALVFTITSQNLEHDQTKNAKELYPKRNVTAKLTILVNWAFQFYNKAVIDRRLRPPVLPP